MRIITAPVTEKECPMTNPIRAITTAALLALVACNAQAIDASQVPPKKRTTLGLYLTAQEAYEVAESEKVLFIDARTRAEVSFVGMPAVAHANIPYMELDAFYDWDEAKGNFKLEPNAEFVPTVFQRLAALGLDRRGKVIVICRSGDRSAKAADLLAQFGFSNVWTVVDGFEGDLARDGRHAGQRVVNGWKNADLPWTYSLAKNKMYLRP
jgi:rhodanese-related sulfurtransferase